MRENPLLLLFTILVATTIYIITISLIKFKVFVDTTPLDDIVLETTVFVVIISLIARHTFQTVKASILFTYIIMVAMVIYLPLLKYPNDLWLYGPWDSSAHYSFALWIAEKGYVPVNNELFYSDQYGHHPGNGLLPAILNIISQLNPLSVSMSIVLLASYITYATLLTALVVPANTLNKSNYLLILSLLTLFTLYLPYYGGVELAYAYVALIAYYIIISLTSKNRFTTGHVLMLVITYLGLLATHLSTAIIILFFIVLIPLASLALNRNQALHIGVRRLVSALIVVGALFLIYEIYVDVYLMGLTLIQGVQRIVKLYIYELEITRRIAEYNPYISIVDLITYLISQYTKNLIIIGGVGLYTLYVLKYRAYPRKKYQVGNIKSEGFALFTLLISSSLTWLVGWFGVGSFMSGGRALPLIQFFFCINILYCLGRYETSEVRGFSRRFIIGSLSLILLSLGFIANYSIHMGPYITSLEGDLYTYPVWTQGALSPFVLDTVRFLNNSLVENSAYRFLCVQPYTGFGLCDLLWKKPKIPTHGFIRPEFTASEAMIELLERYANVVIPMPTSDKVFPGPLGYYSFYRRPLYYVIDNGGGVI
ncbi:MAG: hypothetical protein QXD50_05050, partial [Desulfurococcaceae archaeon]